MGIFTYPRGFDKERMEASKDISYQDAVEQERRQHVRCLCMSMEFMAFWMGDHVGPEIYKTCEEMRKKDPGYEMETHYARPRAEAPILS